MKRTLGSIAAASMLLLAVAAPFFNTGQVAAQDAPSNDILLRVTLEDNDLPVEPTFVRLLRINMDPGANSPLHTHPGPELWRIESGTVTVFVQGPTKIARAGKPDDFADAPQNSEFEISKGDVIVFLPGTAMTFSNKSKESVKIMASVILPAGHQHPAGIIYVGGQPTTDAFKGIRSDILGDGVASSLPAGQAVFEIDRIKLGSGQTIPADSDPSLFSVAKGSLELTVTSGSVQVSRSAEPGPQADAAVGTPFVLAKGDAIFFPNGLAEIKRDDAIEDVTLYRLSIQPGEGAATPVAAVQPPGEIEITGPQRASSSPTPTTAPESPTAAPTATPADTPTPAAGKLAPGATVYVTEADVRLRDAPSTDSNIVTGLTLGQALLITGPSETGNDIVFWPVQDANDPSFAGYVAEQFLSLTPVEAPPPADSGTTDEAPPEETQPPIDETG